MCRRLLGSLTTKENNAATNNTLKKQELNIHLHLHNYIAAHLSCKILRNIVSEFNIPYL